MIRFSLGNVAASFGCVALLLICSCEKHHVGELPEVQKEHLDPARPAKEHLTEPMKTSTSTNPVESTPAEFFPDKNR